MGEIPKVTSAMGQVEAEGGPAKPAAETYSLDERKPPMPGQVKGKAGVNPLSRVYPLPSGGVYYPDHDGTVVISPMTGAQEEIIAGARSPQTILPAVRHAMDQCVDLRGLLMDDLIVDDWAALMIHFFAVSAGQDTLGVNPLCPNCKTEVHKDIPLVELPCVRLRLAMAGEEATWPLSEDDEMDEILAELDAEEAAEEGDDSVSTERVFVLSPEQVEEPFKTEPLPHTDDVISWRLHRVRDLKRAETYVEKMQGKAGKATNSDSKMHSFLLACHITAINGEKVRLLAASSWVRRQPMPVLNAFRDYIREREFGYDMAPQFSCGCGRTFRARLPLDGSLFRRNRGKSGRAAR